MIGNYWNSAWRNLMKRKKFSFINIFGLAVMGHRTKRILRVGRKRYKTY